MTSILSQLLPVSIPAAFPALLFLGKATLLLLVAIIITGGVGAYQHFFGKSKSR